MIFHSYVGLPEGKSHGKSALTLPVPRDRPRTQRIQKEMPKEKTPAITNLTRWEHMDLKSFAKENIGKYGPIL